MARKRSGYQLPERAHFRDRVKSILSELRALYAEADRTGNADLVAALYKAQRELGHVERATR